MSERSAVIDAFLADSEWQNWTRKPLDGDASARRYFRLSHEGRTVILMDAPPANGEDTGPFAEIATLLKQTGFAAPEILAHDTSAGLLLLSDLGETDYAQWLAQHPADERQLYQAATDVLLGLERVAAPENLKALTPRVGAEMLEVIGPHYSKSPTDDLCAEMESALATFAPNPTTLALRDYHAENLIWRPKREGIARVGLLDFQDAIIAPAGYDLASLLRDARRDVGKEVVDGTIAYFAERTKAGRGFHITLACLGVQRNLRILGVFARLAMVMGKRRYLAFMPHVWGHIMQDAQAPELANLRQAIMDTVPEPTQTYLQGLAE